jgi:hypothetical protein
MPLLSMDEVMWIKPCYCGDPNCTEIALESTGEILSSDCRGDYAQIWEG